MITLFVDNLDFVFLIYGMAFFLLAMVAFSMALVRGQGIAWIWLGFFAVAHGITEWFDMLVPALGEPDVLVFARSALLVAAFVFLFEFGRRNVVWSVGGKAGWWIYVPLVLLLVAVAFRFGFPGALSMSRYVLAFPGGLLAALALWQWGKPAAGSRRKYRHVIAPMGMVVYAVLSGLIAPRTGFGITSFFNTESFQAYTGFPVSLLRCGVACIIALVVWYEHFVWRLRNFSDTAIKWIIRLEGGSAIVFMVILIGGFLAVGRIQRVAEDSARDGLLNTSRLIATTINPEMVARIAEGRGEPSGQDLKILVEQCRRIADSGADIRYLYLMRRDSGQIRFILDVEPSRYRDVKDVANARPGEVYDDAPPEVRRVFATGIGMVSGKSYQDRWGDFVSAFIPIPDPVSGRMLAVLGVDQPASLWSANLLQKRLPPLLIIALLGLLIMMFTAIWLRIGEDAELKTVAMMRARSHQEALWRLASISSLSAFVAWQRITEEAGGVIKSERVLILSIDPVKPQFLMEDCFDVARNRHAAGEVITGEKYNVLKVIFDEGRTMAVDDATSDGRVSGLALLCAGLDCRAAIFAPFRPFGKVGGILVFSLAATGRKWLTDEVRFASEVATLISNSLMNHERDRAEKALVKAHEGLELRVRERTEELFQKNMQLKLEIEERRRLEAEREKLDSQVRQTQKLESLGVMAGGIAHDFNNILMAVMGNAELARLEIPPESPVSGYIRDIEIAASRATALSRQMLAYTGRAHGQIQAIDLNSIIRDMVGMLEVSVSKKVTILYALEETLKTFDGDAAQIGQIVMNLVINAAEAIGDEVGMINIQTGTIWCDSDMLVSMWGDEKLPEGEYVYFEVRDTGCGMNPETLSRIFDPFFTTKFTGRGLGLAAVLGIVRGHHGTIDVCSEKGLGTTFRVMFPVGTLERKSAPKLVQTKRSAGDGIILLVDDEAPVREVGIKFIELLGFRAVVAVDGLDAIAKYREYQADIRCVLMDLTMPQFDGHETMLEIRKINPAVKVIICSGYTEEDVSARYADLELAGFLQKPYNFESLAAQVDAALCLENNGFGGHKSMASSESV